MSKRVGMVLIWLVVPYLSRERWEVLSTSKLAVLIDFFQTEIGLWNKLFASLVVHHRFTGENHCYKSHEFHWGMCLWKYSLLFINVTVVISCVRALTLPAAISQMLHPHPPVPLPINVTLESSWKNQSPASSYRLVCSTILACYSETFHIFCYYDACFCLVEFFIFLS